MGNQAFENKNYLLAEQMYEKALEQDASDAKIWNNRAIARMELAKYEEALADAQKAIQLDSTYQNGYLRAVEALIFLRRFEVFNEYLLLIQDAQLFLAKASRLKGNSKEVASLKQKVKLVSVDLPRSWRTATSTRSK